MHEEFLCKKALNLMKDRIKDEVHTAPSDIYTLECNRLVGFDKFPRAKDELDFDGENIKYPIQPTRCLF